MYINDLPDVLLHSSCLLFADDAKIFKNVESANDCHLLQQDIMGLTQWCRTWRITLNVDKCFFVDFTFLKLRNINWIYTINDEIVQKVTSIKDLGVTFTYNLNFTPHINNIVKKSFQMFGFMKRVLKPINDYTAFISMYHTLIRSRLEYCSFVWSPLGQTNIDKIERVQRKFLKFISFKCNFNNSNLSYFETCQHFNFSTLQSRRDMLDLRMFNKILSNKVDCPDLVNRIEYRVPSRRTRRRDLFVSNHRLRVSKNSPVSRIATLANGINLDVFSPPVEFRRMCNLHFTF